MENYGFSMAQLPGYEYEFDEEVGTGLTASH